MYKNRKKVTTLITCLLLFLFFFNFKQEVFAADNTIERITYSEDYDAQESVDEELFGEESEYEEYEVYTEVDDTEDDTTEMIVLAPENKSSKNSAPLQATIEKSYSFRSVEAFNTIWDSSDNFRTLYRTVPSMMQTAPSIIHAANYRFRTDENTSVYWGHAALSSFNDISVGFVGKLESSYDTGLKITTKIGGLNISSAIYDSLETNNPAGGMLVSTDEIKIKGIKGSFIFGGGVYANEYGDNKSSANSGGVFAKYTQGRFSLGVQAGKTQYASSEGKYGTSLYLYPEYKLTKAISISSKIASHLDQNYNQEDIGITYKPFKNNPNDFSLSLSTSLYNGEGTTNKQKFKLSTEFKL